MSPYRDALDETLKKSYNVSSDFSERKEWCYDELLKAIGKTSHVVKATAVAWGAGFCVYAARLMTAIGAKMFVVSKDIPGKGSDVHKVLSIASLDYLNYWKSLGAKRPKPEDMQKVIEKVVESSVEELSDLLQSREGDRILEIKKTAARMLSNLSGLLPKALTRLKVNEQSYNDLRFYTELEMIDYKLHVWGVPDLVIEHPKLRKAIVVEWKSDERSPTAIEKYQAYIYAMLEAIRLGYGEKFDDLVDAIAPSDVSKTKVLPVIIRPNYVYSDHPLLPISGSNNPQPEKIEYLRDRLRRIVITSTYLTLLMMDIDSILFGTSEERGVIRTRDECVAFKRNGEPTYIFRMTPSILLEVSGYPMTQERWQCSICPFSDKNSGARECRFYFGSNEKDRLDKLMWLYRFKVYRERERNLIMYRALYSLRLSQLKDMGTNICGFRLDLDDFSFIPSKFSCQARSRNSLCGVFEVTSKKLDIHETARIGIYEIEKDYNDIGSEVLVAKRKLLPCEEESEKDEIPRRMFPRSRRPVLVVLLEDHVTHPTLGTSLFGRVEKTLLPGERDYDTGLECNEEEACIMITPISPYLRLPFRIFKRYLRMYEAPKALITEAGADLTHIDLLTINSLHLALSYAREAKEKPEGLKDLRGEEFDYMLKSVEEALQEAFNGLGW